MMVEVMGDDVSSHGQALCPQKGRLQLQYRGLLSDIHADEVVCPPSSVLYHWSHGVMVMVMVMVDDEKRGLFWGQNQAAVTVVRVWTDKCSATTTRSDKTEVQ